MRGVPPCSEPNCQRGGEWEHDGAGMFCKAHSDQRLMSDDREDFADEWAREDRRERGAA